MLPLWLGAGLGLGFGLGLRWSLCLGMGYCTNFDLGFGFALRFGAALNCMLGLDFGFGSGFAPCAFAFDLLSCKRKTREQWNNFTTYSSVNDKGATLPRLLPHYCPLACFLQTRTFFPNA